MVETAAVAPIDSMKRFPESVISAMPTAAMPTADVEYMMAETLALDEKPGMVSVAQKARSRVAIHTAVDWMRSGRTRLAPSAFRSNSVKAVPPRVVLLLLLMLPS